MYCATHTIDLAVTVDLVRKRFGDAPILALGTSLGGMITAQYLEEKGEECHLSAAVLFSSPFYPVVNCKRLEFLTNFVLINKPVASTLKRNYSKHRHLFKDVVDHSRVMRSPGIKDFDDAFTAPVFGYDSADHYYECCRIDEKRLQGIRIPTLCVNADDDMFSEESSKIKFLHPPFSYFKSSYTDFIIT